jgi:hypothetical protein
VWRSFTARHRYWNNPGGTVSSRHWILGISVRLDRKSSEDRLTSVPFVDVPKKASYSNSKPRLIALLLALVVSTTQTTQSIAALIVFHDISADRGSDELSGVGLDLTQPGIGGDGDCSITCHATALEQGPDEDLPMKHARKGITSFGSNWESSTPSARVLQTPFSALLDLRFRWGHLALLHWLRSEETLNIPAGVPWELLRPPCPHRGLQAAIWQSQGKYHYPRYVVSL